MIRKANPLDGSDIPSSAITPKSQFLNRRTFLAGSVATGAALFGAERLLTQGRDASATVGPGPELARLQTIQSPYSIADEPTRFKDITSYNNFYEFGVDKLQPAFNAHLLPTHPWTIHISGLVQNEKTFDIETLLKLRPLEERIYRHRCVEGWSMVIPWIGYSLSELIKQCNPLSTARYVQFFSYYDKEIETWASKTLVPWPYTEALRMDEAMHPLTLLNMGLYGAVLPSQNGAPVRITVPWKYGYKSAKSVVGIRFAAEQPATTWNTVAPSLYGFYSNVNPAENPRWSQKRERRIGKPLFERHCKTKLFNGYGDLVASMYKDMDLAKDY